MVLLFSKMIYYLNMHQYIGKIMLSTLFKNTFKKYPMMDGKKFAAMRKYAGKYQNTIEEDDNTNTDWQDLLLRTGVTTSHDLGVSGGTKGGSYSIGAGYYHDESVLPTQGYDRYSVRANFDQNVGKYFHVGLTTNNNYNITNGSQVGMYNALSMSPLASPYDENGNPKRVVNMPIDHTHTKCANKNWHKIPSLIAIAACYDKYR